MSEKLETYRQGDVFFIKVDSIPDGVKEQEDGVIIEGETTGHAHRVASNVMGALLVLNAMKYIQAKKACDITHEDHGTVTLPPGNYQVKIQDEYTPQGRRQVAD
jgi:hypothetical protein